MLTRKLLSAALVVATGAVAAGATLSPSGAEGPSGSTIYVPNDFVATASDTRATGHYELVGSALRVWTEGATSTDKVAEYVATDTPLASTGEPSLNYRNNSDGTIPPGFQLIVDFDGDSTPDGILVGEKVYNGDWWLNRAAAQFVKDGAPAVGGGAGSDWHGTLDQWRAGFPSAQVKAFGFSLGSGVKGDWTIDSIDFGGSNHTFGKHVVLTSKNQCKNGGWATSTKPAYADQGSCVSSFASSK